MDGGWIVGTGWAYGGLAGVVETEEEQLGVLVCKPKLGEHVPDCVEEDVLASVSCCPFEVSEVCAWPGRGHGIWVVEGHQHTPVNDPHVVL